MAGHTPLRTIQAPTRVRTALTLTARWGSLHQRIGAIRSADPLLVAHAAARGSGRHVHLSVPLDHLAAAQRHDPREALEEEPQTRHARKDALGADDHPPVSRVIGALMPRADQAAILIDMAPCEVGAQMPAAP